MNLLRLMALQVVRVHWLCFATIEVPGFSTDNKVVEGALGMTAN